MFSLSPLKFLFVVAVIVLLLGPDKLPEVAHKLGSTWRAVKKMQERVEKEVRDAIPDLPSTTDIARIARNPVNMLNTLADRAEAREAATAGVDPKPAEAPVLDVTLPMETTPSPPVPPRERPDVTSLPPDPSLN